MANYKVFYLEGLVTMLGDVVEENDYSVTVNEPQIIMVSPQGIQTQSHFALLAKKNITFRKTELLCDGELFDPDSRFLQSYLANKAGIQVAPANTVPDSGLVLS